MEQLKLAWSYRFWIIVGIVLVMPVVSWFVDTRSLASNAQARAGQLKGTLDGLGSAAKGPNPNETWVKAVSELTEALSSQVDVAWEQLYERQAKLMTWPEPVQAIYLKAGPTGQTPVDRDTEIQYQNLYPAQLEGLFTLVQPVGMPKSKGQVEMDPKVIDQYRAAWAVEGMNPPTVRQAWLAQEDIWLLRALLGVVQRANKDSNKLQESAVKRILDIQIGGRAIDATLVSKLSKDQLSPRGGVDEAPASGTAGTRGTDLGEIRKALYREIPVSMKLIVDQPRILNVLAEFGNSEIPMQVMQVDFAELPMSERHAARLAHILGDKAKKGPTAQQGTAPPKEDEFFHMAELDVWARAIFYSKPPKIQEAEKREAEKAAPEKAPAQPTPPPAPAGSNQ